MLADWGADVLKIEHSEHADPIRSLEIAGRSLTPAGVDFMWELHNRGKRGLAINLSTEGGAAVLVALLRTADVFVTNFLPTARRRLGLEVEDVRAHRPDIVYAR